MEFCLAQRPIPRLPGLSIALLPLLGPPAPHYPAAHTHTHTHTHTREGFPRSRTTASLSPPVLGAAAEQKSHTAAAARRMMRDSRGHGRRTAAGRMSSRRGCAASRMPGPLRRRPSAGPPCSRGGRRSAGLAASAAAAGAWRGRAKRSRTAAAGAGAAAQAHAPRC